MRVGIIGANLLGCATAFYTRKALEQNESTGESETDEIIIFEANDRTGGNKFVTLSLGNSTTPCGTAAQLDISSSPLFQALLKEASIAPPSDLPSVPPVEWSLFDWDADAYRLSKMHSRLLSVVASSLPLQIVIKLFVLLAAFFSLYPVQTGIRRIGVFVCVLFAVFPLRLVFQLADALWFRVWVRLLCSIQYGGPTISTTCNVLNRLRDQLRQIDEQDACTSGVTLVHLLSACGLAKFAKQSATELFSSLQVGNSFLNDCCAVPMSSQYGKTLPSPCTSANSLAFLLSLLSDAPVPDALRANARYLSAEECKRVCPKLAEAANAEVRLGVRVVSVQSVNADGDSQYEVHGVLQDGSKTVCANLDAVVLACVVHPDEFSSNAFDADCSSVFSLQKNGPRGDGSKREVNVSKFVSLVRGEIKPSYFRLSRPSDMSEKTYILNSVNCSEVQRLENDVWKITSSEPVEEASSVCDALFKSVTETNAMQRSERRYSCTPLRETGGGSVPDVIISKRFINAAAIDRIANDVNADCLAARNAASFFKHGVITWK